MCCGERPGPRPRALLYTLCTAAVQVSTCIPECATRRGAWCSRWSAKVCGCDSSPAFADSFRHPQHPPRVPPRFAHCGKTEHIPHETRRPGPHPRNCSPNRIPAAVGPRNCSPNTAPTAALPRKNSPSKPKNTKIGVFSARWANYFAHRTQQHGDDVTTGTTAAADAGHRETPITTARPSTATDETDNTTATEKRTQNTHFSPAKATPVSTGPPHRTAKAMAVSVETQPVQAKATAVSDNRTPG